MSLVCTDRLCRKETRESRRCKYRGGREGGREGGERERERKRAGRNIDHSGRLASPRPAFCRPQYDVLFVCGESL